MLPTCVCISIFIGELHLFVAMQREELENYIAVNIIGGVRGFKVSQLHRHLNEKTCAALTEHSSIIETILKL